MKKLFFDLSITGHHSEYIGHLIDYLYDVKLDDTMYYFVLHPEFSRYFPEIYKKAERIKNVYWIQIKYKEYQRTKKLGATFSSFFEFRIANSYAKKLKVDNVCFMNFHVIKYAGMVYTTRYDISSILFLSFYRLRRDSYKQMFEYYKRYFIIKISIRNSKLKKIFVLNDVENVGFMNNQFDTSQFNMLPDPIPKLEPIIDFDIFKYYNISRDRKIFLHIGALSNRKGTFEVINAAKHITSDYQKNVSILIVGKANNPFEKKLYQSEIVKMKKQTDVEIIWDNNFVQNNLMKSLFDNCDAVLLPYKNAEFSSGILGHAAMANKTVIATGQGLIKELVVKYKLGLLLNEPNQVNIAIKVIEFMEELSQPNNNSKEFVNTHSPKIFSKILLAD